TVTCLLPLHDALPIYGHRLIFQVGPHQGRSPLRVAVAFRLQNRTDRAARLSGEFFRCRLARAARDSDDGAAEFVADGPPEPRQRSEEHRSELQSRENL